MKIFYCGFSHLNYSVNSVYIRGLREAGAEVVTFEPRHKNWRGCGEVNRAYKAGLYDLVIIGYNSPLLVIYMRIIGAKHLVYNALCSVYERLVTSRDLAGVYSVKSVYYWLIDFFAAHSSSVVMLESGRQADYFRRLFMIPSGKCFLARIGVDDRDYDNNASNDKFERFTAVFRGRFLPEAGAIEVVRAAKKLEGAGVDVILSGNGQEVGAVRAEIEKLQPENLITKFDYLNDDEKIEMMRKSHVSIGQVASHPRLERTIPHKCYESLALGTPYLTGRNAGVLELLKDGETCLTCNPGDAMDLATKILWAKEHYTDMVRIGENGRKLYERELTPKILAEKLLRKLEIKK